MKKNFYLIFLCGFLLVLLGNAQTNKNAFVPDMLVVKVKNEYKAKCEFNLINEPRIIAMLNSGQVNSVQQKFPKSKLPNYAENARQVDISTIYEIKINIVQNLEKIQRNLINTGLFEYVEKYYLPQPFFVPNDPYADTNNVNFNQYSLLKCKIFEAWNYEQGDTNVVMGIVDSGTDFNHPDLIDNIAYNYNDPIDGIDNDNDGFIDNFYGWDLGENDNLPQINYYIHGAHVSGIAAATVNNGIGVAGIGYKCKYLPIKVDDAQGNFVNAYEGIVYAAEHGCKVINCSWGGTISNGQFGQDIIDYATYNHNCLVIASAGNSNNDVYYYPASYDNVLSVGATDNIDNRWISGTGNGSVFNYKVDVCAPGKNIFSTINSGLYGYSSGTSMAAPMATAAAALLKSRFPNYNSQQLASLLRVSADKIDTISANAAFIDRLGSGRINALNAITQIEKSAIRYIPKYPNKFQYFYYQPGDTFHLHGIFINDLALASNVTATISTTNEFIQIIDSVCSLGTMATLQEKSNISNPFVIKLKQNIPINIVVNLKIQFFVNGEKNLYEYLTFVVNADYVLLQNSKLMVAANSRGGLVHQNEFPLYNLGLLYEGSNISACNGLMLGQSSSKVSDNVYAAFAGYDEDFRIMNKIQKTENINFTSATGYFNDLNAENPLQIQVKQQFYTFRDVAKEKILIVQNTIKNVGSLSIFPLYVGWYNDFDIGDARKNRASFDPQQNLGYIFSTDYSLYAGTIILNNVAGISHYAIDNDGAGGEINLYDANYFSTYEKFKALTAQRFEAGSSAAGNDVSQVLSCGPFLLNSNDSITVAFALLVGATLNELNNNAQLARNIYLSIVDDKGVQNKQNQIKLFPNPANDFVIIDFDDLAIGSSFYLQVENIFGQIIFTQQIEKSQTLLNIKGFEKGVYVVKIVNEENVLFTGKLIKD